MTDPSAQSAFAAEIARRARAAYALAAQYADPTATEREELLWRIRREAHTLRGSALVIGLDDAVAFAADLEQLAASREIDLEWLGVRLERVLAALPSADDVPRAARTPRPAGSHRILCVDDSEPNLLLLERYLGRRGGVEFVPARSGEEGLELVAAERPDLILLDLQLPGLDGLEVLERLNARETAAIPVVVLSADAHGEQIAAAQELGARDYLVKPLDLTRLGAALDTLLSEGC